MRQRFKQKKEFSAPENYYFRKDEVGGSNCLFSEPPSEKQVSNDEEYEENHFVNVEVSTTEINMSDEEDEEDDMEHEIHHCNQNMTFNQKSRSAMMRSMRKMTL